MNVSRSPVVPRRRLGSELRRLREVAHKTVDDAAAVLECSASKISRLETGKGVPRTRDVRDLIEYYGNVPQPERDRLLRWASEGQGQGWWNDYRDVLGGELMADHLLRYITLEGDASKIRSFEPEVIPGLLQSEEYVYSMSALFWPESSAEERARYVQFRMRRKEYLHRGVGALNFEVIVGESALQHPIGDQEVMRRQLESLRKTLEESQANLTLRVLPRLAAVRHALGGSFSIVKFEDDEDQDVVYFEGREGATYLEKPSDVERYDHKFDEIEAVSLNRADSLARIDEEIRTIA